MRVDSISLLSTLPREIGPVSREEMQLGKTSVPRLRRITYKDGRSVTVIRPTKNFPDRIWIESHIRDLLDSHGDDISGFAIVVWDKSGASTARMQSVHPSIPVIYVPDFVRNRLLALKIEEWAREE